MGRSGEQAVLLTGLHTFRWVWVGLLTAVFLFTLAQAIWQLSQPITTVNGIIVNLTETRPNGRFAAYALTLRTNEGTETTMQLRNNGRILTYLLSLTQTPTTSITIEQQAGIVITLQTADTSLHETISPFAALVVAILAGVLALPFLRPGLLERS